MTMSPNPSIGEALPMIVLGAGGHARSVVDSIQRAADYRVVAMVGAGSEEGSYRGIPILSGDECLVRLKERGVSAAHVGIGYLGEGALRRKLVGQLLGLGFELPPVVDPTAILAEDASVGAGAFLGKRAVVNVGACIGAQCIINTAAVVEHDSTIGEFSHLAPGAVVCGGCRIGADSFIGAHATIIHSVSVGRGCTVGAGSVVLDDVRTETTIAGVPAHAIETGSA